MGVIGGWSIALINMPAALALTVAMIVLQKKDFLQNWRASIAIGLFTGLGLSLYGLGLLYAPVVRVTLLFYLTPIWATILGIIFLGEQSGWARWVAIIGGLTGLFLLVSGGMAGTLSIGDIFGFFSGIAWAIGATLIKKCDTTPLLPMCAAQFWATSLIAILLGLAVGSVSLPETSILLSGLPIGAALSIGIFLPGVLTIFWAQKFLFPGRVGLLMMSEVLVAVISASLLLPEERLDLIAWIGALLIIGACAIEVLGAPKPQDPSHTKPAEGL